MPYAHDPHREGSVLVPILLIVFAFVISISVVRTSVVFGRLDKTDRIACQFLKVDATNRSKQAINATKSAAAQKTFIVKTNGLIKTFKRGEKKQTASQRAGTENLVSYLVAQRKATERQRSSAIRGAYLAKQISNAGARLAAQLHC